MNESVHRLFVAVPLPADLKEKLSNWMNVDLKKQFSFRKWVHPADLHITLQFLGDTPTGKRSTIAEALREAAGRSAPLTLTIEAPGIFGQPNDPSILWAGIGGDVVALGRLQQEAASALQPLGFVPEERRFHPHLTLARSYTGNIPLDRAMLSALKPPEDEQGGRLMFTAGIIVLYESRLQRRPMYEVAARLPLSMGEM